MLYDGDGVLIKGGVYIYVILVVVGMWSMLLDMLKLVSGVCNVYLG